MNTFVLTAETASIRVEELLAKMAKGNITLLDEAGNTVAYVLSPVGREELIYADAQRDLDLHRDEVQDALERRDGVTTQELLKNARRTAEPGDLT